MRKITLLAMTVMLTALLAACAGEKEPGPTPDTTPPTISEVSASDITQTSATITWTSDETATSQVEYGLTTSYGSTTVSDDTRVTSHTVSLSVLTPGTRYHYRVKSKDAGGNEAISEDRVFTTLVSPDTTPPTISQVTVSSVSDTAVTITWTTDEGSTSQVEYSTMPFHSSVVQPTSTPLDENLVTSHSVAISGLTPDTVYYYRVISEDDSGNEVVSGDHTFSTADTKAPTITEVTVSDVTESGVTITWTTDEPATSQVEYGQTIGYGLTTTLDESLVTNHSIGLGELMPDTTYHFRVRSEDGSANEAISADYAFTTPEGVLPADVIFFNGQVVTMEPDMPQAEALAIQGENILAVGTNEEILGLRGPDTQVVDLGGKALLPGFVDTHVHLDQYVIEGHTFEEAQEFVLKDGTTTVGYVTVPQAEIEELKALEQEDSLRLRTAVYLTYANACGNLLGDWYKDYPPTHDPSRMLQIVGVKLAADGGYCMRPAFSFDLPEWYVRGDPKGDLYFTEEELAAIVQEVQAMGYQAAIHAIGDRAIETVLNGIEAALDGQPNSYRHRIDHSTQIRPEMLTRYGELGIVAIVFGQSPACSLDHPLYQAMPEEYYIWQNPLRQLIDANPGLHIGWHSDRPFVPGSPIPDLYSFITRNGIAEDGVTICEAPEWLAAKAITVQEALRIMTIEGAYALFMEEKIGSLKPGKFADLVVLSDNPLSIDPDSIIDLEVLLTMVGGRVEYCAPGHQTLCPSAPAPAPDFIFFNGQVVTMEPDMPQAEALAIQGEEILAVGSNDEILSLRATQTQVIDLEGKALLPGFVDAHTHVFEDVLSDINFANFEEAQQFMLQNGITAIGWPGPNRSMMEGFLPWAQGGNLRLRASLYLKYNTKCRGLLEEGWYLDYPIIADPTEMLRIPGIKIYMDPGGSQCGLRNDLLFSQEELAEVITDLQDIGYQVAIHVCGELGVETTLNAIEIALDGQPNTYRHRMEHNSFIMPRSLARYGEIGIVPVTRGSWGNPCSISAEALASLPGEVQPSWFFPVRPLLDTNPGLRLAWHSDGLYLKHPLEQLWGFVTRKGFSDDGVTICEPPDFMADDVITVEEALRVMTINSAYSMLMDEKIGSLKPGKLADFVILSDNPLTVDPDSLIDLQVLLTMVGGRVEYCAPGHEDLCSSDVHLISQSECGDGYTCYHVQVSCEGLAPRGAEIRASRNPDSKGTVIFLSGGWGTGWYGDASDQQMTIINTMKEEGYETYEIRWLGEMGWGTDNSGQGFKKLTCGSAQVVRWIVSIATNAETVGATGHSGGANELAYGLTIHGLEDILDVAVLTGGPGRVDLVALCQMDVPSVQGIVDYVMGWQGDGDCCTTGGCPEWAVQALQSESIITSLPDESRDYYYPNTMLAFVEGEIDIFAPQGWLFYDAITSEKSWVVLPGVGHGVPYDLDGAARIQEILLEGLQASS